MKVNIERTKLYIIVAIAALIISNFVTYNMATKKVTDDAKKLVQLYDGLSKIDFDYINSLNALYQTTMEWGNINSRLNVKYASGSATPQDVSESKEKINLAVKDIEELTKLVLRFKAARETHIASGNK